MKTTIKKYDTCKKLAKNTRGWLTAKDWMKIFKIQRLFITEEILNNKRLLTPMGTYEAVPSTIRQTKIPGTNQVIETGRDKLRIKYSPARYFKEKLNGRRTED